MHAVCAIFSVVYHAISHLYMKLPISKSKTAKKFRISNFLNACHFDCILTGSLSDGWRTKYANLASCLWATPEDKFLLYSLSLFQKHTAMSSQKCDLNSASMYETSVKSEKNVSPIQKTIVWSLRVHGLFAVELHF